jgi:ADP-L-glycero-D-manno-heptose 6-epimerase
MKILLTGHRGFIGGRMLRALAQHDVVAWEWGDEPFDIRGCDWVIHIGAISSTAESDVAKVMTQNYDFSVGILDQCIQHGINLQYSSSASVYGLGRDFRESAPPDPRNAYAWSKYLFERYAASRAAQAMRRGIEVQGFRYFNVYGTGEEHKGNQASPFCQFRRQAQEQGVIRVFENSDQYRRDFVPVETVVDYHLRFLQIPVSGVFNIGTGTTQSFLDIARKYGRPIQEIPMPEHLRASYQTYTCADMTRTWAALAGVNQHRVF